MGHSVAAGEQAVLAASALPAYVGESLGRISLATEHVSGTSKAEKSRR